MRLVRKVSRKRYYGKAQYESERFLLPIPAEHRALVKPLLGQDLEIFVKNEAGTLVVRVKPINKKVK